MSEQKPPPFGNQPPDSPAPCETVAGLPEDGRLGPDQLFEVPGFADRLADPDSEIATFIPTGGGGHVSGVPRLVVRMGGENVYTDAYVIDTRTNPETGSYQDPANGTTVTKRTIGKRADGSDLSLRGDFVVVIPSGDDRPPVTRALVPGKPLRLGRSTIGGDVREGGLLAETVSRQHCELRIADDGTLQIQNLNPANQTRLLTGEHASGERLSEERAAELLSYSDVLEDLPQTGIGDGQEPAGQFRTEALNYTKESPSGRKYMTELQRLVGRYGEAHLMRYARSIRDEYARQMQRVRLPASDYSIYAASISWAMWDIAKQSYLARHPEESSADYIGHAETALADPLDPGEAGRRKRREILYRHVGWEIARRYDGDLRRGQAQQSPEGDGRRFAPGWLQVSGVANPAGVYELLTGGERNDTGQHRSRVLRDIGHRALGDVA